MAKNLQSEYPIKPFIEPFEFIDDDYEITEKAFRVRKEDILSYKENVDNIVEITVDGNSYTVKETIEEIDALYE